MNCNLLKLALMDVTFLAMSSCKISANRSAASSPEQYAPRHATVRALNPIVPPGVYIADLESRLMPDGRIYVYGSRDVP